MLIPNYWANSNKERLDYTEWKPLRPWLGVTGEDRWGGSRLTTGLMWAERSCCPGTITTFCLCSLSRSYSFLFSWEKAIPFSFLLHLNLPLVTLLQPVDKAKLLYPQSLVFLVITPVLLQNWVPVVFFLASFLRNYSNFSNLILVAKALHLIVRLSRKETSNFMRW